MAQEKLSAAQVNRAFYGLIEQGQTKEAADMATDFLRIRIRESSAFEKILPGIKIGNEDLTPQLNTDKPVFLCEMEPNSPGGATIPLGSQPISYFFHGSRFAVYFDLIVSPRFTQTTSQLRTYGMDIRQVITDNAILDMDFEQDRRMLAATLSIMGAEGSTVAETGVIQNKKIVDSLGITRNSLADMFKILPSTFAHLTTATVLVNSITVIDVAKFGRDEVGGDLSQEMLVQGFNQKQLFGVNWIVTNKHELVSDSEFFLFASPEFMGKSLILEETTMYVDKKAYNIEFFAYTERGATIKNIAAVARARIATS